MKYYVNYENVGSGYIGSMAESIAYDVVDRMNDGEYDHEDLDQCVFDEMDRKLIYDDQWQIMKEYQTPQEANFDEAVESLQNDVWMMIGYDEDEDEEEGD